MPRRCSVRNHPEREAIDKALGAGTPLLRIAAPVEAGVFEVSRRAEAPVVTQRRAAGRA